MGYLLDSGNPIATPPLAVGIGIAIGPGVLLSHSKTCNSNSLWVIATGSRGFQGESGFRNIAVSMCSSREQTTIVYSDLVAHALLRPDLGRFDSQQHTDRESG